jgi:hypothetical protein
VLVTRPTRPAWVTAVTAVTTLLLLASCSGAPASASPTSASGTGSGGSIVAQVASYQLVANRPGRLIVAILSTDNRWLSFGTVEMSFDYLGSATATPAPGVGVDATTARYLPIPGTPEGASGQEPTLTAPADGRGLYGVEPITFPAAGYWRVTAQGRLGGGESFSADAAFEVLAEATVLGVGDVAPLSDNPVADTPGVSPASIDSRAATGDPIPDPELHATSIASAIGAHHPALVVFATPVYCVSRFCGPVTDMVADLAAAYGDRADFIHVEIYEDFEAGRINQAAIDWLQTPDGDLREPWVFLVGSDGHIAASWDTMVTRAEIEPLLQALPVLE